MICSCAESNKQAPIHPKCGDPITDAFFRFRRSCMDLFPKFLKGTAMFGIHTRKVLANCFGFCVP
jgi:hypothetical protein